MASRVFERKVARWKKLSYEEVMRMQFPHEYTVSERGVDLDVEVVLVERTSEFVHVALCVTPVARMGWLLALIPLYPVGPSDGIVIHKSSQSAS